MIASSMGFALDWYNGNWLYSQQVNISGSTGVQLNISIDTYSLNNSGKLNGDCSDLRFLKSDNTTLLNYWIWNCSMTNGVNTTIWVNTTQTGSFDFYMYYGNPLATSYTDCGKTFYFCDDFLGTSLNTTIWDTYWNNTPVNNSVENGEFIFYANTTSYKGVQWHHQLSGIPQNSTLVVRSKVDNAVSNWGRFGFGYTNTTDNFDGSKNAWYFNIENFTGASIKNYNIQNFTAGLDGGRKLSTGTSDINYHIFSVKRTNVYNFSLDDTNMGTLAFPLINVNPYLSIFANYWSQTSGVRSSRVDYIFIMDNQNSFATAFGNESMQHINAIPAITYISAERNSVGRVVCQANVSDTDNATLSVATEWFVNGVYNSSFDDSQSISSGIISNISTIYSANTSPSQNWSCRGRAYDGLNYSNWSDISNNATTTSSPSVNSVIVERNISGDLDCYVTAMDDETSSITIDYKWFNGTTQYLGVGHTSVSNNTETLISSIPFATTSLLENWSCEATAYDNFFYSSALNGSYYIANYPPIIVYVRANQSGDLNCYVLLYDNETMNLQAESRWYKFDIYESGYYNLLNATNGTETLVGNVPYANITNDEEWKCEVRGYDFLNYTDWVNSSMVKVIKNTPPYINSIALLANNGLSCKVLALDSENVTLTADVEFYKNLVHLFPFDTTLSINNGTLSTIGFVGDNSIGSGEEWECRARVSDGINTTDFSISDGIVSISMDELGINGFISKGVIFVVIGIIVSIFAIFIIQSRR
jgi:hypothetical protein